MLAAHLITRDGQHLRRPFRPQPHRCVSFLLLHQKSVSLSVSEWGFQVIFAVVAFAGRTHVSPAEWVVQDTQQIHVLWLGKVRSTTAVLWAPSCSYVHVEMGSYTTFFTFSFRNSKLRTEGELCSMVSTVFFTLRINKYIQSFNRKKDGGQPGTSQETENPLCPNSVFDGLQKSHFVSTGRPGTVCLDLHLCQKERSLSRDPIPMCFQAVPPLLSQQIGL